VGVAGRAVLLAAGLYAAPPAWPQEQAPAPAPLPRTEATPLPTFAELEAAGARIGEIRVVSRDIFDLSDPGEDNLLFRWANALHLETRPGVIRRALLFKSGDPLSVRVLEETERLLRAKSYIYDVQFRPLAYQNGVVDIEVSARDTWSLNLGLRASRTGGANTTGIKITEGNLFGTGTTLSVGRSNDVDRTSNELRIANDRAFGHWTSIGLSVAENSDGYADALAVARPFYALDTRWAGGLAATRYSRIEAIYNAGNVASEYRHRLRAAEAFGGWSDGLVDGRVRRTSLGVAYRDDAYATEPGRVAPPQLPADQTLVGPFVRLEFIEDRFDRQMNRDLIGRPEFFALGLASTVRLGWAGESLGSSQDTLVYAATISRGFKPAPDHTLMASANIEGQYTGGRVQRQRLGGQAQYYRPQSPRWLFYASAAVDLLTHPDVNDTLVLGGEEGLRGYPLRYQSGTRRALFTVEQRLYTDVYLWRLFRIGGAAFYDLGRAWGGENVNQVNPGWLNDVGFGLRIGIDRSAFGNVVHVDVAFPLNATPDIQNVQFLVTTKSSF
jgi:hypothetical protein